MKHKVLFIICLFIVLGNALSITQKINFDLTDLAIEQSDGYDLISLRDCELTDEIGAPLLPAKSLYFVLPHGAKVTEVKVLTSNSIVLGSNYNVMPTQPPAILVKDYPIKRVEPNPRIYNSFAPYPQGISQFVGQGNFGGKNIAMVIIYPLQYIPNSKLIRFYKEITIAINYEPNNLPDTVQSHQRPEGLQGGNFKYLVITNSEMDSVFQRLCHWKTKKGIKAVTRSVNWITSNYPGRDNPEKIRNYLKTLYPDSGLIWLLLGGDVGVVPIRKAYAMPCSAFFHSREDSLPCDLYYSDLDGTWDFNGNNVFGEVADSVDLFPDIFVGRAPVNNQAQARAFVNKIINYEKNPPLDYMKKALFAAEILWSNPYTDGGVSKDWIDSQYLPLRFDPITKLYERLGNLNPGAVISAINNGKNLINHNGHGWIDAMSVGTGILTNSDMDNLTNGTRQGILYSIGCWTSAFDFDAISEHFVRNPNGGGVAFIGHSSYGWGSPGNPRFGYSDRFDGQFYAELFLSPAPHIGKILALAKAHFIAHSRDANVYRWHQYQLNLLGDPEMMIATDSLKSLLVLHPNSVPFGTSQVIFTVTDNGIPIRNALVCVQKGNELYERGYTGFDGQVRLNINPTTLGNIDLTVTAPNFLPYETEIPVINGGYISYLTTTINDSLGNNDHIPNPGETIGYSILFKNEGNAVVNNIIAKLTYYGPEVTVLDSLESIGNLNPNESLWVHNGFQFHISPNAQNGKVILFTLTITDDQSNNWTYHPNIIISTPIINLVQYNFSDSLPNGNNNGILEPGETVKLRLLVKNRGFGIGYDTRANISTTDPYLSILNPNTTFGNVLPDSYAPSQIPLELRIESNCPAAYVAGIRTEMTTCGDSFIDTVLLFVGPTGLDEDFEAGGLGWTHGGVSDLWHLSPHRANSPNNSFYCGDTSYRYLNNMNCYLLSPPFVVQPNSVLSFWCWFLVPIYGVDGLYVIIESNHGSDTLDFIGTGGALGKEFDAIPGSWLQEKYSLNSYEPGETLQVRFVFVSDNSDVSEGFYIDDVLVRSETSVEENLMVLPPKEIYLSSGYPNPFRHRTTIYYNLPSIGQVNIKIYNRTGRLVKNLINETKDAGYYYINWDGRDDNGKILCPGVYFVVLKTKNSPKTLSQKLILLK